MKSSDLPVLFFNNCRGFKHAEEYGRGAFFDLNTDGVQANQATNLQRGDVCVVATPSADDRVAFNWYSFQRESIDRKSRYRVFFGKFMKSESLPKAKAVRHRMYSACFNIDGHFKRQSTIQP